MRCPNCGGLNPDDAQWCGQCLVSFAKPFPEEAGGPIRRYPEGVRQASEARRGSANASEADGGAAGRLWTCPHCLATNPLAVDRCTSCGRSLFEALSRSVTKEVGIRGNPGLAAALSIVPGLGHIYLRRGGEASLRLLLAVWWIGTVLAVPGGAPGSSLVRTLFILAVVALIGLSVFDAYQQAEEPATKPVLSGKLPLYWSFGMLAVLMLGLMLVALGASR